jgi:MATE family multidrug resistance protein
VPSERRFRGIQRGVLAQPEARVRADARSLLALAWPIIVSRASQSVIGLADAWMVAHLGRVALAATTTGAMNSFSLFILPMGTVFIVSTFASQFFGKGDLAGARRYAIYGLGLALLTQVLAFCSIPFIGRVLPLFGFPDEVLPSLRSYLVIRLLSSGAVVGTEALGAYYGGLGNTRPAMRTSVAAMALNVFGNWVLIDGRLGAPALGVDGAAWASVGATVVTFAGFLWVFVRDTRRAGAGSRLRAGEFVRMLRYGLPSGLNWFFEFYAFIFFINVVVAGLGTAPLAAFMAVLQINSVSFMPAFAIASAGAIVCGQAIGARAHDEVPGAVRLTFLLAGSWQTAVGVIYVLLPALLFAPFVHGADLALLAAGTAMLRLSAAWQLFDAAAMTLAECLRAAGDTAFTLWVRAGIGWAIFVPGSYYTVRVAGGGETAAMAWVVAYLAILALVLYFRFRGGAWRRFDLVSPVA